jgi:hypothetical protein
LASPGSLPGLRNQQKLNSLCTALIDIKQFPLRAQKARAAASVKSFTLPQAVSREGNSDAGRHSDNLCSGRQRRFAAPQHPALGAIGTKPHASSWSCTRNSVDVAPP